MLRYGNARLHNDTVTTFNIHGAIHGGKNFKKAPTVSASKKQVDDNPNFSKDEDDAALRALNNARHRLKFKDVD